MSLGNQIQMLRKINNITQEKLAAELGVSVGAVSKWETGNAMPDVVMLCVLADFFDVTTDELLGRNKMEEFIICDDAPIIRDVLRDIVVKEGYHRVVVTESGEHLLATIGKNAPFAILLDINLPDANRIELLKSIKTQNPKIKVVMVTADDTLETENLAISYGAEAYVTKPFLPERIKEVIASL